MSYLMVKNLRYDMKMNEIFNFLADIPVDSKEEIFETLFSNGVAKIERIISYGQTSEENFWYDQDEDEFVLVLKGDATIEYDSNEIIELHQNDSLFIPAHQKHRVKYTSNTRPTVWLAIFYQD